MTIHPDAKIHSDTKVHPQAIVEKGAIIGAGVEVGPWSYIGEGVEIGEGSQILSHVVVKGPTTIGRNNKIFQFASVGEECQDKKYAGEPTRLIIGDNNIIRENCTIHRGTTQDQSETIIGSDNLFMAYVHVAHDCVIGDNCIFANSTTLAGHVHVASNVILGGGTMVHQFCKIGAHSMSAGGSIVLRDIPAFVMASGQSASAHGLNTEGLKRRGFTADDIRELKRAYKVIYRQGLNLKDALIELEEAAASSAHVAHFVESIKNSSRGIIR
ncbi:MULTISPECIES: acyl-ACP--UDP-N-acetylglucosamine O-acyltransferase [unclassified Oleiphilus]|jgi:UDP-N-acetylglucosamine acyltransferase|uniref:acyl-ACP--UDP-N-acetylglucosamine O-acyltransferase n=3 Tax=Oleiphilus TaxID=141450 RepID=UPI0007C3DE96|nr:MULTISPECIES: acyl-ACP--UDP-N-acetylglucosamine O-acyltransferase [unclassified Oleiphilus]KZY44175.1 acyl-[acyl-carrier-protein]--UDP-N-acetylglucosamine O-acyltransferase [Oleiphilus sp. HI0050]KZY75717.1 acyl-[acyl-carrier-protein]--UDP-N-acetylglucosamine O-acyltransferase [Oleiphilus sp. HI0068]KZY85851.1 acyl-[acyl-carrier-protein]--UDP-N-acetylglucosamine O-acyltransferase [Oleiphilus sp. HI0069]KZY86734.1 acyl-[acyl-carrier-protein]--UDP-N-acetylglucosamine O-acyltransferase [Oleiphi